MLSDQNKYLKLRKAIDLTEVIDSRIAVLDKYFQDYPCEVTSGLRTAQHQLELIMQKCSSHGFPISNATLDNPDSWLNGWGKLLTIGEMINPPYPTRAPFDYVKPNGDKRSAGNLIGISNHMQGHAFDIGGYNQELKQSRDLTKVQEIIFDADKAEGGILIAGTLLEPVNGALHIDCKDGKLNSF
jgi:hypothetical protein